MLKERLMSSIYHLKIDIPFKIAINFRKIKKIYPPYIITFLVVTKRAPTS
jgi:hypothetical protein